MLKIKLLPRGKKHQITYRIVVAECRSKSNGKFIDDLGFYTPQTKTLELNKEKMAQWIKNGAQVTNGVDKLLNPDKYPNKIKNKKETKVAKVKKDETSTEETGENKEESIETPTQETKEEKTEEIKEEVALKTEGIKEEVKEDQ